MRISDTIRWIISVPLVLLGCWIMFTNVLIVYRWLTRREHHSFTPLLGGTLAFLGMLICPSRQIMHRAWIPLALDIAYLVLNLTCGFAVMGLQQILNRGKKNS
jgi:hypothetical protein